MGYKNLSNKLIQNLKKFHVLIFQHLDGDEMLKLTEVDSELNRVIANCPHCMCRLTVHLTVDKRDKINNLQSICKSRRQYRHFRLTCGNQDEISAMFLEVLGVFFESVIGIDVNGVHLQTNQVELSLPKLKELKISASNLNALHVFLESTKNFQTLLVENFYEPITDRRYMDQIMRYRCVRLINMEHMNMNVIKNLDFLYSNCVDFHFESNRKSNYEGLARLFEIIRCTEIKIRWMKAGCDGYSLTLHRLNRVEDISIPVVDLYERKKRRRIKNDRFGDAKYLPAEYFLVLLEIRELSWSFMKKIGRVMNDLKLLSIFPLSELEKKKFFLTFKNLEKIVTTSGAEHGMEVEETITRSSFDQKIFRLDPLFKINSDHLELVFQHFTFWDFQRASQVSGSWNNIISKSSKHMQLTKLCIKNPKVRDCEDIGRSMKHFENIEVSCNYNESIVPHIFKLLNLFANFIVELNLHRVKAKRSKVIYMPNLKILTLHSISDNFCSSFLDNCVGLKSLKLQNLKFNEKFFYRIKNQRELERLYFVDVDFLSDFKKPPKERIEMELAHLKHLEVSFYMFKIWNEIDHSLHFEKVLDDPCFLNLESLAMNGMRSMFFRRFIKMFPKLKKLELRNIWEQDIREMDQVKGWEIELYLQNFHYLEKKWNLRFPDIKKIYAGRTIEDSQKFIDDSSRNFIKMMKISGKKMIENDSFTTRSTAMNSFDPLLQVSEDLHDLIFQHFDFDDAMSSLEVSGSWNIFSKNSRALMDKIRLKIPITDNHINRDQVKECSKKHHNIYLFNHSFHFVKRFSEHLKDLTVVANNEDLKIKPEEYSFPNLEVLTIQRHILKGGKQVNVKNLLSFFRTCRKLKLFVVHEALDGGTVNDFFEILKNNRDLKEIKIFMVHAVVKYFEHDWADGIECKLQKITLGLYDYDLFKATKSDYHLLRFIQLHRHSCEELILSHCSTEMFHEVFTNYTKIHTFFAAHGFRMDEANLPICYKIKNCVFPYGMAAAHFPYLIERLPNVEYLFLSKIDTEGVQSLASNMGKLKLLVYYTAHENCIENYSRLTSGNNADFLNTNIRFKRIESIKFEDLNFDFVFKQSNEYRPVPIPVNFSRRERERVRGRGRRYYDMDDDEDLDMDDYMEMDQVRF